MLAQQIVAEVAAQEWSEDGALRAVAPRRGRIAHLSREDFDAVVAMLAEGFSTRRGRRGALIHHDAVNHVLRGRRGARLTALTSGGTIPDNADYQVMLEPENQIIGTVNEDFAVESMAGDIFQLGNNSYRILRVERGTVRVEDAQGMAPTIPFWLGEAPGRSDELSASVSRLRARDRGAACGAIRAGRRALALAASKRSASPSRPPSSWSIIWRRRTPRWGAADARHDRLRALLRRGRRHAARHPFALWQPDQPRLGPGAAQALLPQVQLRAAGGGDRGQHRAVADHGAQLRSRRGAALFAFRQRPASCLIQALLDAPMFMTRWRWVAGVALALPRFRGGKKVPPHLARMDAEDLLAAIFPDQIACAENLAGAREIPDHPLVRQTIADCLDDAMDVDRARAAPRRARSRRYPYRRARSDRTVASWRSKCWRHVLTPISTTRRLKSAALKLSWPAVGSHPRRPRILAGLTRRRSSGCARKPGRSRRMSTNCMMLSTGSGFLRQRRPRLSLAGALGSTRSCATAA